MGPWTDFLMVALALGAGWLGLATLTLAGWRPAARRARPRARIGAPAAAARPHALDSDR